MLATGGSATAAIEVLKKWGAVQPVRIKLINLIAAPEGVAVTVTPTTLEFVRKNEKRSYTVEFSVQAQGKVRPAGTWDFGHISWENRKHRVRSPVAFNWQI
jgi:hypothetical protein